MEHLFFYVLYDVDGEVPDDSYVLSSMTFSDAREIFFDSNVENPIGARRLSSCEVSLRGV